MDVEKMDQHYQQKAIDAADAKRKSKNAAYRKSAELKAKVRAGRNRVAENLRVLLGAIIDRNPIKIKECLDVILKQKINDAIELEKSLTKPVE